MSTRIAILLFDGVTALDAIGPFDVLRRLPGAEVVFVAPEAGEVRTEDGALGLIADRALRDLPDPEIVLVPGGVGTRTLMHDEAVLDWVRTAHEISRWTSSVCTGALILGGAGILDGLRATTHWMVLDSLAGLGAEPVCERVVPQGKVVTAAGVSAGIDMALWLAAQEAGEDAARAIQLALEYDPQPPFDCGSPAKAGPALVARLRDLARRHPERL